MSSPLVERQIAGGKSLSENIQNRQLALAGLLAVRRELFAVGDRREFGVFFKEPAEGAAVIVANLEGDFVNGQTGLLQVVAGFFDAKGLEVFEDG